MNSKLFSTSTKMIEARGKGKVKLPLDSKGAIELLQDCNLVAQDVKLMNGIPLVNAWVTIINGNQVTFCHSVTTIDGNIYIRDCNGIVTTPNRRDSFIDNLLSNFLQDRIKQPTSTIDQNHSWTELEVQVMTILAMHPNSTALEIKDQLAIRYNKEIFKSKINSLLYGNLKNEITKDSEYRWKLSDPDKFGFQSAGTRNSNMANAQESAIKTEIIDHFPETDRQIMEILYLDSNLTAIDIKEKLLELYGTLVYKSKIDSILIDSLKYEVIRDESYRYRLTETAVQRVKKQIYIIADTDTNVESAPVHCEDTPSFKTLFSSEKPHYLISDTQYNLWISAIKKSHFGQRNLSAIASELNLTCHNIKNNEKISNYLDYTLVDIFETPDPHFRRILLLCIANIAMNKLGSNVTSDTSTSVAAESTCHVDEKSVLDNTNTSKFDSLVYWSLNDAEARDAYYKERLLAISKSSVKGITSDSSNKSLDCQTETTHEKAETSFTALLASEKPHYLISDLQFSQWIATIKDSDYRYCHISDFAGPLNLFSQSTEYDHKISDYLDMTLAEVFELTDSIFRRTLLLCIADIAINKLDVHNSLPVETPTESIPVEMEPSIRSLPYGKDAYSIDKDVETPESNPAAILTLNPAGSENLAANTQVALTFESLMTSDFPIGLVSDDVFNQWVTKIKKSDYRHCHISDIADELGVSYQGFEYDHRVARYLDISIHDLYKIPNPQFSRTLLLCVAFIVFNKLENTKTISEYGSNNIDPSHPGNCHHNPKGLTEINNAVALSIIRSFKEGRESAIGISRKVKASPSDVVALLQKKGYISKLDPTSDYNREGVPPALIEALNSYCLTFDQWCSSLCVIQVIAKQAIKQLSSGEILRSKWLKVIQCLKQDFPEVYTALISNRPSLDGSQNGDMRTSVKTLTDGNKAEKLFIKEGKGIVTIAKELGLTAMSVFSLLVQAKAIKRKSSHPYYIGKIPQVLSDQLKKDGLTFGIWCTSINTRPNLAEKYISFLTLGIQVPDSGRIVIEMLKQEYPEIYTALLPTLEKSKQPFKPEPETINFDIFLRKLKLAGKPENLLTDDMWSKWSMVLTENGFGTRYICIEAQKTGLFWPESRGKERFDRYLNLPLANIRNSFTPAIKRALLICAAIAANTALQNDTAHGSSCHKTDNAKVPTEDIVFRPDSPLEQRKYSSISGSTQNKSNSSHNAVTQNGDIDAFMRKLKLSVKPDELMTEEMWSSWTKALSDNGFIYNTISIEAKKLELFWPALKTEETFEKYFYLSLDSIRASFGLDIRRTLVLCTAYAACAALQTKILRMSDIENVDEVETTTSEQWVPFEIIRRANDPTDLISEQIWECWKTLIRNHPTKHTNISDLVDELGALWWQARWGKETIYDYLCYNFTDLKAIQFPGKARTITICFAKLATDIYQKKGGIAEGAIASRQLPDPIQKVMEPTIISAPPRNVGSNNTHPPVVNLSRHSIDFGKPRQATLDLKTTSQKVSLIDQILDDYF
jgi:hypothetical protein